MTFDAVQWTGVVFFTFEFGGSWDKDFQVEVASPAHEQVTGSLAATASQEHRERSDGARLDKNSIYIPPGLQQLSHVPCANDGPRNSCQKRQKIFDYSQEGHVLATKEVPKLEDLGPRTPTGF